MPPKKLSKQDEEELQRKAAEAEKERLRVEEEKRQEELAKRQEARLAKAVYEDAAEGVADSRQHLLVLQKDRLAHVALRYNAEMEEGVWDHYVNCRSSVKPNLRSISDITTFIRRLDGIQGVPPPKSIDGHMTDIESLQKLMKECKEIQVVCERNGDERWVTHFEEIITILQEACEEKRRKISKCLVDSIWASEKYDECNNKYISKKLDSFQVSYWININKNPRLNTISFIGKDSIKLPKSLCISPIAFEYMKDTSSDNIGIKESKYLNLSSLVRKVETAAAEEAAKRGQVEEEEEIAAEAATQQEAAQQATDASPDQENAAAGESAGPKSAPGAETGQEGNDGDVDGDEDEEIMEFDPVLDIPDNEDPSESGSAKDFESHDEHAIDQSVYSPIGSIVSIVMAALPPEPWTHKNWTMKPMVVEDTAAPLSYPLVSNLDKMSSQSVAQQTSSAELERTEIPPMLLTLGSEQAAAIPVERLKAAWWNANTQQWSSQDMEIVGTDNDAGTVSINTFNLGKIRLFQERFDPQLLPLRGWELTPHGPSAAKLSLHCDSGESVGIFIRSGLCQIESISTMDSLPAALTTPRSPEAMLALMEKLGCTIALSRAAIKTNLPNIKLKHAQAEGEMYFCMSLFAGTHTFRHDKDNVHRSKSIVLQARAQNEEEWSRIMWDGRCAYEITEAADGTGRFYNEIVEGAELHGDLYHLLNSKMGGTSASGAGTKAPSTEAIEFEMSVYSLLAKIMPLSVQGSRCAAEPVASSDAGRGDEVVGPGQDTAPPTEAPEQQAAQ